MISLILTGHGHIASGLNEAITQIFGKQDDLTVIDFPDGASQAQLKQDLEAAIQRCPGDVVVFTDMLGGSPFRYACLVAETRPATEVVSGMNLAMFAEVLLDRDTIADAETFRKAAVASGREGVTSYAEYKAAMEPRNQKESPDGI